MFAGFIVAAALVATAPFQTTDGANKAQSLAEDLQRLQTIGPNTPEPPQTSVTVGDPAPDFSYESHDRVWVHLHDLLEQGDVMLVFGVTEDDLRTLEAERDALLNSGVVPVAVVDRGDGATWSIAQRLHVTYSLLSDPRSVIAGQFDALDPTSHRAARSFFVVDRRGIVRGLNRGGLPADGYVALAAKALSRPLDGSAIPANVH